MLIKITYLNGEYGPLLNRFCQYVADFDFTFGSNTASLQKLQDRMERNHKASFLQDNDQIPEPVRKNIAADLDLAWLYFKKLHGLQLNKNKNVFIRIPDVCRGNKHNGKAFYIFTNATHHQVINL